MDNFESEDKKTKFSTGTEALDCLTEKGRITDKEYWIQLEIPNAYS